MAAQRKTRPASTRPGRRTGDPRQDRAVASEQAKAEQVTVLQVPEPKKDTAAKSTPKAPAKKAAAKAPAKATTKAPAKKAAAKAPAKKATPAKKYNGIPHPGTEWKALLEKSGMNQKQLEERTGITGRRMNDVLNQRGNPTAEITVRFARALGLDELETWAAVSTYLLAEAQAEVKMPKVNSKK